MAEIRNCEQCGSQYAPRREHARFCSAACRYAWNSENTCDPAAAVSALQWSLAAMADTVQRLPRVKPWDVPRALAAIGDAVWRITIVDATMVRHHPETYDAVLTATPGRRRIEGTLGGLRFVRNRMRHAADRAAFIRPAGETAGATAEGFVTSWTWKPVAAPEQPPALVRGYSWEMTRYRAYQAYLAGRPVGDILEQAAAFLRDTGARAALMDTGARAAAGAARRPESAG